MIVFFPGGDKLYNVGYLALKEARITYLEHAGVNAGDFFEKSS
jgi:hypothetical protein